MTLASNALIALPHSTLGELCDVLDELRQRLGDGYVVMTEVGLTGDVFVGHKAVNVRVADLGGRSITISADAPANEPEPRVVPCTPGVMHYWPDDAEYGDTCNCGAWYRWRDSIQEAPPPDREPDPLRAVGVEGGVSFRR